MCEWGRKVEGSAYRCRVPPLPGGRYCIFHEPGPKDVREFQTRLAEQLGQDDPRTISADQNSKFNFIGYHFPLSLTTNPDHSEPHVLLPQLIAGNLQLSEAVFMKSLFLVDCLVQGQLQMLWTEIRGIGVFSGVAIDGDAWLAEARFFSGARFDTVAFKRTVYFAATEFRDHVRFRHCSAGAVDLGCGVPQVSLLRVRSGFAFRSPRSAESFWGFVRHCYETSGDREHADAAFYLERCAHATPRRIEVNLPWWNVRNATRLAKRLAILLFRWLPECVLLRWPIAYGGSLSRLAATWVAIMGGFGTVFSCAPSLIARSVESIWNLENWIIGFQFSVTTFTTLGLGDIYPEGLLGRFLTSLEAVLGGIIMALTVLVIGRKFMR